MGGVRVPVLLVYPVASADNAVLTVHTHTSKILILWNTPLFKSCVTLEETETKLDLQLWFKKGKDFWKQGN